MMTSPSEPARRYVLRPSRVSLALEGLRRWALKMAETAVVVAGAEPRAVVAELQRVLETLRAQGWYDKPRQEVMRNHESFVRPAALGRAHRQG